MPLPVTFQSVRWSFPAGVVLSQVAASNPPGCENPNFLKIKSLKIQVPWWGIFFQPAPAAVVVERPVLDMEPGNAEFVNQLVADYMKAYASGGPPGGKAIQKKRLPPSADEEEDDEDEEELEASQQSFSSLPQGSAALSLVSLKLQEARIDFIDRNVRQDAPALTIGKLTLEAVLSGAGGVPTINTHGRGSILSAEDKEIGFTTFDTQFRPIQGWMEGRFQIWHDKLNELKSVYSYAPQPFLILEGKRGPIITWKIRNGKEVEATMESITENFQIDGMVGDAPWQSILNSVADSNGRIDLTVTARGRLDDPTFNIHDRLISELDWLIRERSAAAGVDVKQRIFFGLEKPPSEEEEEEEEAEEPEDEI